jgi:hypothetical protein
MFSQLATRLVEEGQMEKAAKAVEYVEKVIPATTVPHNYSSGSMDLARVWSKVGNKQQVEKILQPIAQNACDYMSWYLSLPNNMLIQEDDDIMYYMYQLHNCIDLLQEVKSNYAVEYAMKLDLYNRNVQTRLYGSAGLPLPENEERTEEDLLPEFEELDTSAIE